MYRREYVATGVAATTALLAGCSGSNPETSGNDDEPIEAGPESLLLTLDAFDGDSWEAESVETDENSASQTFVDFDAEEQVQARATVYENVEDAQSAYQEEYESRASDSEGDSMITVEEGDIASHSYLYQIDIPNVYFRDANATAKITHSNFSGSGSASKAKQYAAAMHETWR